MGVAPSIPRVPDRLAKAMLETCLSARRTGRVIDIADESARLLKEFPDSGMARAAIGEALVRECALHHGVNVVLNGRDA